MLDGLEQIHAIRMRGLAAILGVVPGQPFTPGQTLTAILDASAAVGKKYAATVAFDPSHHLRVWPDRHWTSNMIPALCHR